MEEFKLVVEAEIEFEELDDDSTNIFGNFGLSRIGGQENT